LSISALVKTTFEKTKTWFVERAFKIDIMLHTCHYYPENIMTLLRKNQQDSTICFVERFNAENFEFDIRELATPQHDRQHQSYTVKLNDWWPLPSSSTSLSSRYYRLFHLSFTNNNIN